MLLDQVLREVGDFGRYQILLYILVGLVGIPSGFQNVAISFLGAEVDHWCDIEALRNFTSEKQRSISAVLDHEKSKEAKEDVYDKCLIYKLNYSSYSDDDFKQWDRETRFTNDTETEKCQKWVYGNSHIISNALTKWDMVCDNSGYVSLIQTVYMAGYLTGSVVFGQISDKFGRKKAMLIALLVEFFFALAATFTPIYGLYVALRFVVGACVGGSFTSMFVLSMETIGPKWRMETGIAVQGWFAMGIILISPIAYLLPEFRNLQLALCAIIPFFTIYIWIIPESPRWLVAQGRDEEAEKIFRRMAEVNGRSLPENLNLAENRDVTGPSDKSPTMIDLFRGKRIRVITIVMWFGWFVTSLCYYGLSLGVALLPGSLYLTNFLSGVVELPSYVLAAVLLHKIGRKWPLVATFVLCGVFCVVCGSLIDKKSLEIPVTVFLMLGKFFGAAAFAILYVYAAELFPTVVRNVGVGSSSMCARVAGIVQPQIQQLSDVWQGFPFIIYGVTSLVAGLTSSILPETLNQQLPETLEDVETFGNKNTKLKQDDETQI